MLQMIRERWHQGFRTGKFPKEEPILPPRFRGLPKFTSECPPDCNRDCETLCPFSACKQVDGRLVLDLGRCLFCADCPACPHGRITFGSDYRLAVRQREDLLYSGGEYPLAPPLATGACSINGGPFLHSSEVSPGLDPLLPVDLYIPGCPPHPYTILDGLLRLLGRR